MRRQRASFLDPVCFLTLCASGADSLCSLSGSCAIALKAALEMKPTIYLALVDDWELSGNGSGDIRELQFQPMRELVRIYNAVTVSLFAPSI